MVFSEINQVCVRDVRLVHLVENISSSLKIPILAKIKVEKMYTGDKLSVKATWACWLFTLSSLVLTYFAGFDSLHEHWDEVTSEISSHALGGIGGNECTWKDGDPVLYHMRTKLGVNYEGDHWFHIAENFMTQ
jgi:hypothetical protein